MKFSLILPFHTDVEKLIPTLEILKAEAKKNAVEEILLCHNGKALSDSNLKKVEAAKFEGVRLLHTDTPGIGAGYKLGITNASQEFLILSASDLPFGWTDLQSFKKQVSDFAIGSKAHHNSILKGITPSRRLLSFGFFQARRLILGRRTPGDSQGSFFVRTSLARELIAHSAFDSYLFSLELASLYLKKGGKVVEVPIQVINNDGESSVSVSRDSVQMFKDLLRLRKSLRRLPLDF